MDIDEGYYDCIPERAYDHDKGECTAYTAYMNGQPSFTLYLYDKSPNIISIHEGGE